MMNTFRRLFSCILLLPMFIILAHGFIPHHHHFGFIQMEKNHNCCEIFNCSDENKTGDFNNSIISFLNQEDCHACHYTVDEYTKLPKNSIFIAISPTIYKYIDSQYLEYLPLDIIKDCKQSYYSSTRLRAPPIFI